MRSIYGNSNIFICAEACAGTIAVNVIDGGQYETYNSVAPATICKCGYGDTVCRSVSVVSSNTFSSKSFTANQLPRVFSVHEGEIALTYKVPYADIFIPQQRFIQASSLDDRQQSTCEHPSSTSPRSLYGSLRKEKGL